MQPSPGGLYGVCFKLQVVKTFHERYRLPGNGNSEQPGCILVMLNTHSVYSLVLPLNKRPSGCVVAATSRVACGLKDKAGTSMAASGIHPLRGTTRPLSAFPALLPHLTYQTLHWSEVTPASSLSALSFESGM